MDPAGTAPTLLPFIADFDRRAAALPVEDLPTPGINVVEGSDMAQVRRGHPTLSLLRWHGDAAIDWVDQILR